MARLASIALLTSHVRPRKARCVFPGLLYTCNNSHPLMASSPSWLPLCISTVAVSSKHQHWLIGSAALSAILLG